MFCILAYPSFILERRGKAVISSQPQAFSRVKSKTDRMRPQDPDYGSL